MTINIYTKAEVDAHLALLASHASAIQDAITNGHYVNFNQPTAFVDIQKSKRIIEQGAEIGGDVLLILDDCGDTSDISDWVGSKDALNPVDNQVYVKQGNHSMALGIDADLSAEDRGTWINTISDGNLSEYQHDWLYLWIYIPTLDHMPSSGTALNITIGSSAGNRIYFYVDVSDLSVGWNLLKLDLDNPDGAVGTINWSAISYKFITVYEKAGNTNDFTIYVDSIMFVRPYG